MTTSLLEPPPSEAAGPYWEATRRRELVLPWCTGCELCLPPCPVDCIALLPAIGTIRPQRPAIAVYLRDAR